jgi:multicomponent Na+:H+ antiporter subunit E
MGNEKSAYLITRNYLMIPEKQKISWLTTILRGLLFAFIWLILSEGVISSWWIGVPAVLLAVFASIAIPPAPIVWYEVPRFVFFFLMRSLVGGTDVAWRALHPRMPIAPDLVEYPLRISPGLPQVFVANTVSLLPGTLSAELHQGVLKVHALDKEKDFIAELESAEQRVAKMFGVTLSLVDQDKQNKKI